MSTELETLPAVVDVDQLDTAKPLVEIFQPFETTLAKWQAKVDSLTVTDINQKTEMAQARLARLELKDARVMMDKTRKGLVEKLKARTGKIDAAARLIREKMERLEQTLWDSETFGERHAAKVKSELKAHREAEMRPLVDIPIHYDLSDLSDTDYAKTLDDARILRQAKIDAAAKLEAERLAKIEADRLERERIAAENARLKAEAVEKDRLAEIERKRISDERAENARLADLERKRIESERQEERRKAQEETNRKLEAARKEHEAAMAKAKAESDRLDAIATKEREAIRAKLIEQQQKEEKLKRELAAKAKAEADEKARIAAEQRASEKAKREAELASDEAKLLAFAAEVRNLKIPTLKTISVDLPAQVESWAKWLERQGA